MTDKDKTDDEQKDSDLFSKSKRRYNNDPPLSEARRDELNEEIIKSMDSIAKDLRDKGVDIEEFSELARQEIKEYRRRRRIARFKVCLEAAKSEGKTVH